MFTVAAVSTNVAALPIGTILDRYGPRVCGIIGSIFLLIGALLFSFASQINGDAFTPGYFFLALGGTLCLYFIVPAFEYLPSKVRPNSRPFNGSLRFLFSTFPPLSALVPSHERQAQYSEAVPYLFGCTRLRLPRPDLRHAKDVLQVCQRNRS